MKQFFTRFLTIVVLVMSTLTVSAQQLPNSNFDDWSGAAFDGNPQPKSWNASHVEQVGMKFNFAHKETGRSGSCIMVQDQSVGAMGITEESPGYIALGKPWQYLPSITAINQATAGTSGGINFTYRPDSMIIWVKRTGNNWSKEDFHVLFYSWKGTAKGTKFKGKNGSCTSHEETNEESDIRQALNGNECGTATKATQIAEGWLRDRKEYTNWTRLSIPIFYMNNEVPEMCNVILSASNYPNFRANSGLYEGNSLYADDIELIYSSKIQELYIGGKIWNAFDPNSTEEQVYSVGQTTVVPEVYAVRGVGTLTNTKGTSVTFPGRRLSGNEISIQYGQVDGNPTVITVKSGDGKSTTTYKIKMVKEPSHNATLNSILVNGEKIKGFTPQVSTYNVALPYGTTEKPVVTYIKAEDEQTVSVTQATSTTGTATLTVTAADGSTKKTYTLKFSVAQLSDNTLDGIKVNGELIADFIPTLTTYRVELPVGTTTMPTVEAVSAYPQGAQTIKYTAPDKIDGGQYQISVTTPGNQNAKVYKLNFKITASSNCKLKDLKIGNYITNFNPDVKTYYITFPMGTTEMPEVEYVKGDQYQTVDVKKGGIDGTTTVTVTAGNGTSTMTYKIICNTEKSEISYLNMIYLDGEPMPGFQKEKYKYSIDLPTGSSVVPAITWEMGDPLQKVSLTEGGLNATTYILVTADNGSTSLYEIYFSGTLASVSTLEMITLDGKNLEGFEPDKTEYTVVLPQGTTQLPVIGYTQHDDLQTVYVREGGVSGDTKIIVRSQAGTQTTYVLHFSVYTSSNTTLQSVSFNGVPYAEFDPQVRDYDYVLPEGVSQIPSVSFVKGDETQKVVAKLNGTVYTIRVIAENGEQGVYTFNFIIQKSENAYLNMIYLDGEPLVGFSKDKLDYEYILTTTACPTITVDKDPSQHVLITAPATIGLARIVVTPESGAPNTYTINFTSNSLPQLQDILVNGETLQGFVAAEYEYEVKYVGILPEITPVPMDATQKVTVASGADYVHIYVEAGEKSAMYSLTLVPAYSEETALRWIALAGVTYEAYQAETYEYTEPLSKYGDTIPAVTFGTMNSKQHVTAGLSSQYDYSLVVTAESGVSRTYVFHFTTGASSDTEPVKITLDGVAVTFDSENTYTQDIELGKDLPELGYVAKDGQTVVSAQTGDTQQQLIVVAEDGTTATYTINYNVQTGVDNALLNDIRIQLNGVWSSIKDFKENTYAYTVNLPRDTTEAPCVWPVAGKPGQTITVTYGPANGDTKIHVKAANGDEQDYTLTFATPKSANNKLKSLSINLQDYDVNETEIIIDREYGATEPYEVEYEKAEAKQLIEFISAPITGTTKIIVTAENGDKCTYSIRYNVAEPQGENKLLRINYSYENAQGESVEGSIVPVKGNNPIDLPFGSTSFSVDSYEKSYAEQAVLFYNGGIRRGATLIVSANRDGVEDVTYTLTPRMPEFSTAGKLKELKFKGALVPNFRPDVYNYMINVTAQPTAANFTYATYNGESVTPSSIDAKKKQITFKVADGETYSVCWYYTNYDKLFDFSGDWVAASKGIGYKPSSKWTVPADCDDGYTWKIGTLVNLTYTTGKEVTPGGTNGVMLSTLRGAPMNGSVPGMMTLGAMSVSLTSNGNSTSSVSKGASYGTEFKNTPEAFTFLAKPLSTSNITNWKLWLTMSDGSKYKESNYAGNFSALNTWQTVSVPISYDGVGTVSKFNVMLSSCDQENAKQFGGGTIYESSVMYDQIHFTYNSELTAVTVNGKSTTMSGNTFTYTLKPGEVVVGFPALKFTGKVHDQTQTIEWLNNGEWINGELTAKVTNYGENSKDYTEYFVVLKRDAVTSTASTVSFGDYTTTVSNDTVFVNMPYGTKTLPNITVEPESVHQHFDIVKSGKNIKVKVTAEDGSAVETVYVFREVKSSVTNVAIGVKGIDNEEVALSPAFDVNTTEYTVTAFNMPVVTVAKANADPAYELEDVDLGQTVDLKYTAQGATVLVTAADGTTKTYTIAYTQKIKATYGALEVLTRDNVKVSDFAQDKYDYTEKESENIGFARKEGQETDAIVETLTDEYVAVAVKGTADAEAKTYKITYPTEQSANANLADVLINGSSYDKFNALISDIPAYESDEPVDVKFILAEPVQTMEIAISDGASGVAPRRTATRTSVTVFTVTIKAENGDTKTYRFTIRPQSSNINTLKGIYIDGELIEDFYPEKTNYTYVIPAATPKLVEPDLPNLTYVLGQESQKVTVEPAQRVGQTTVLSVTPENDDFNLVRDYKITFTSEPSHNAELEGILVNGKMIDGFKPSRTYYSCDVLGDESLQVNIDYVMGDPFQKVEVTDVPKGKALSVTAQDGSTRIYEVDIYRIAKSNNANLADILFDNMSMELYAAQHNIQGLKFEEKTYRYTVPLLRTDTLPDIAARLQDDAQTVTVSSAVTADGTVKTIHVVAEDGESTNDYELLFAIEKSKNTTLSMIFIGADSLKTFVPEVLVYDINLPIGQVSVPSVDGIASEENVQTVEKTVSDDGLRTDLDVTAENGDKQTYSVIFHYTYSSVATLKGIYEGADMIDGFRPDSFYYAYALPMGVRTVPFPLFEPGDNFQLPQQVDTIVTQYRTTYMCKVTAHDGLHTETYTLVYDIQPSNIDTLRSITVDVGLGKRPLEGFRADELNYTYIIPKTATQSPVVDVQLGDSYQDTLSTFVDDTYKITVTAENGRARTYIIRFEPEKSDDPTLITIYCGEKKELKGFDPEKFDYTVNLPYGTSEIPLVTYLAREGQQTVMAMENDTITIDVTAENGIATARYTLAFVAGKSQDASLAAILLDGVPYENFYADTLEYTIMLPYGTTTLPKVTVQTADSTATYDLIEGDEGQNVTVSVTSADEEHFRDYEVHFIVEKCPYNWLEDIRIWGKSIEGFDKDSLIYTVEYPVGTDSTAFFPVEAVTWTLADPSERVEVSDDNGTVQILVTAANGSMRQYDIRQVIMLAGNSLLKDLTVNGRTITNFDPETYEYTYIVLEGEILPSVEGIAQDEAADVLVTPGELGGATKVFCVAPDGSETLYTVHFELSSMNSGITPRSTDVLLKQIAGSETFAAYSIRLNTKIAIYDDKGHLFLNQDVPVCNPNNATMSIDPTGREVLIDASGDAAYFTIPVHGQTFFYLFYSDKTRLQSGKFVVQ